MSIKCVISGVGGSHDSTIESAIIDNSDLTDAEIEQRGVESFATTIAYADSVGAEMVIVSTTGLSGFIASAETYYPDILAFVPLGSNTYVELTVVTSIPVIVTCGAGDNVATANETAYGNGLEFWDNEVYGTLGTPESSYSNGVLAGKLYTIKTTLNCSWWEARYRARITASNNGVWDKYNGYGKIDVQTAIANRAYVIPDPYVDVVVTGGKSQPGHIHTLRGYKIGKNKYMDFNYL